MSRNLFASALSVLLLGGSVAVAQTSMEKKDEKKTTTADGTKKSTEHTVVGTVKSYDAGKTLKVKVGKKTRSFDLDAHDVTTTVDPAVAVGSKVRVVEAKSPDGTKTLTVSPAG